MLGCFAKPIVMKTFLFVLFQLAAIHVMAQQPTPAKNLFIITIDGLRWQEVFGGADKKIINNPQFVSDTALAMEMYDARSAEERRKRLMPFFWSVISGNGQLHGNRNLGNKVDVSNLYKISYPGYNEIFTGYADPLLMSNESKNNKNENLLEFLNKQSLYKNQVAVFASWNVFPFILNRNRSNIPINAGYENYTENDAVFSMLNRMQDSIYEKEATRYDALTFLHARQYIKKHHPKVVALGLGETDEFAHKGRYDYYLQQISNTDKMIAELWYMLQTDSFYRGNSILMITTDHGRGNKPSKWHSHSMLVSGAANTWIAMIGPGIKALGEIKGHTQIYQKQFAATAAGLIHQHYEADGHPVAASFTIPQDVYQKQEQSYKFAAISFDFFSIIKIILAMLVTALLLNILKKKANFGGRKQWFQFR